MRMYVDVTLASPATASQAARRAPQANLSTVREGQRLFNVSGGLSQERAPARRRPDSRLVSCQMALAMLVLALAAGGSSLPLATFPSASRSSICKIRTMILMPAR